MKSDKWCITMKDYCKIIANWQLEVGSCKKKQAILGGISQMIDIWLQRLPNEWLMNISWDSNSHFIWVSMAFKLAFS